MEQKIPNAVILEPIVKTDYIFGVSAIDNEIKVENGDWTPYLPTEERQRREFETSACTNFSSCTDVEILLNRLIKQKMVSVSNLNWLFDKGYIDEQGNINFSDRYDAVVSNTKPEWGNSLKAVADAKHKFGLIPESMLSWVSNQIEYYDKSKITPEMYAMGEEFLKRFPINYEFVYKKDFVEALKVSPLAGALFAWNGTQNDVYYEQGQGINHAIVIIEPKDIWQIMDSYDPFVKKLTNNYNFYDYAIRYIVSENIDIPDNSQKKNMYTLLRNPKSPKEVYAFNEKKTVKRHITNRATLIEGAKPFDQYWVWSEGKPIVGATPTEFDRATEMAEILLLGTDSSTTEKVVASGFSLWNWIKKLFSK